MSTPQTWTAYQEQNELSLAESEAIARKLGIPEHGTITLAQCDAFEQAIEIARATKRMAAQIRERHRLAVI